MRRLGIQSMAFDGQVLDALLKGPPAVFLFLDPDAGWVERVRQAAPSITLVGRLVGPSQTFPLTPEGGRELARRCIAKMEETGIRWWVGANERSNNAAFNVRRLVDFERAFAETLRQGGGRALIGGFGSGATPIPEDPTGPQAWALLLDALRAADGFHFHEYWHVSEDGIIPNDPYHVRRFEKWYRTVPDWAKEKWFLVSELGIESPKGGWRGAVNPDAYVQALRQYGETLRGYPRFAATVFHAGPSLDPHWMSYDIRGKILEELAHAWSRSAPVHWGEADGMSDEELERLDDMLSDAFGALKVAYENLSARYRDRDDATWFKPQTKEQITHYVLHHTATAPTISTDAIYQSHLQRFGGIGYHFVIYCARADGGLWRKVRLVRTPFRWGAHVKGQNQGKLGIAWVGDYRTLGDSGLLAAFEELFRALIDVLDEWLGHRPEVTAHRLLLPGYTECPGGSWVEPFVDRMNRRGEEETPEEAYRRGFQDGRRSMKADIVSAIEKIR